jgi:tryptophan synthase alpha chain
MTRIQETFRRLAGERRKALIPFITAGDPDPGETVALMHTLAQSGADIIELGVPFSDPMADGPVIQRSSERALKHGVGLEQVLGFVAEFRGKDPRTPVVLMGYANPVEAMGMNIFVQRAQQAGVDGIIVVDYPPEECSEFAQQVRSHGMDLIFLLAPTSTDERVRQVAKMASGYLYYVSLKGITGATIDTEDVIRNVERIRRHTQLPIGVGFGIKDGNTARTICEFADAAIIGSRIIQEMENAGPGQSAGKVRIFVSGIRSAMDEGAVVKS